MALIPAKGPAIGIDLGTTYSCVAVYKDGKVEIITNEEGYQTTPSYVAFTETGRLVGEEAKNQAAMNPSNTVFDAKRLIGRRFEDAHVQSDMKKWPFKVINDNGKPKVQVTFKGQVKTYHAEEISSMILGKMKETAEKYLGQPVSDAVITVPAYFNDAQRQTTRDAGAIAGLNVQRIISEPTAAAIAYGLDKRSKREENILIFDLGGGTFDVSILHLEDGVFEVKATAGDTHLGGEDFDNRLVDHFVKEFKSKYGKDLARDPRALRRLRTACEKAKRALSSSVTATIDIDYLLDGIDYQSSLTRETFERLCGDLFRQTLTHVDKALNDAKLKKKDINEVVLVGGSTRIPKVQSILSEFFNGKTLNKSINPDEAVAYGAAIQAAKLSGEGSRAIKELCLIDVTPLTLGIGLDIGFRMMESMIPRNSTIPTKISKTFHTMFDYQPAVKVKVFQGERPLTNDNIFLGEFRIEDIVRARAGEIGYKVTFELNADGILSVTAVEERTGKKNGIKIENPTDRLPKEDVDRMVREAERYRADDQREKERVEAMNDLAHLASSLKISVEESEGHIPESDRRKVLEKASETMEWVDGNKSAPKSEYERKKRELEQVSKLI